MIKRVTAAAALILSVFCSPVLAQLQVTNTRPSDGRTEMESSTTVAFEFSESVDLTTDWNTAFAYHPESDVTVKNVAICLSLVGECDEGGNNARFVRLEVEHEAEGDFAWVVDAIQNGDQSAWVEPFVLHYTTRSTIGQRSVQGAIAEVTSTSLASSSHSKRTVGGSARLQSTLRRLLEGAKQSGLGRPAFEDVPAGEAGGPDLGGAAPDLHTKTAVQVRSNKQVTPRAKSATPYDATRIYLLEEFDTAESGWEVRAADAIAGVSGSYTINYVRGGRDYWPVAVRYARSDAREIVALGFYDADEDSEPDPVTVGANDRTDIDLTLYEFSLTTSGDNLAAANAEADLVTDDQSLIMIEAGAGARAAGTAYTWHYTYYSPSLLQETEVAVDPLGATAQRSTATSRTVRMETLAAPAVDSDEALQIALNNGGEAFLSQYSRDDISTSVQAGNLYWHVRPSTTTEAFWRVEFVAAVSSGVKAFRRYIDTETGGVLDPMALPVELTRFTVRVVDGSDVVLDWTTASETGNAGFEVEHRTPRATGFTSVAFVEGAGTTQQPQRYRHRISGAEPGMHRFRLRQVDTDGSATYLPEVEVRVAIGAALILEAPYPNPLRARGTVRFGMRDTGPVRVELFDAQGRHVRTLHAGEIKGGRMYQRQIEAAGLASGLYYVRIQSPSGGIQSRPVTVVR
jgi:hypothetical protein